jgi:hypothetical protein
MGLNADGRDAEVLRRYERRTTANKRIENQ